jgi:hypothetical protein
VVACGSATAATLATALVHSCKRRVQRLTSSADAREMSGYGVYVIELKRRTVRHAICSVYVGSSWMRPSKRQKQHHDGHPTGARGLQGKTRRLRPELYLDLPWQPERADAVALERNRARRLRDAGFQVQCDGWNLTPPHTGWRPFGATELGAVEDCLEEHLRGLLATSLRLALDLDDAVRLLRWRSGDPSVGDLVTTPNEHLGRFSHVEQTALRGGIAALQRVSARLLAPA